MKMIRWGVGIREEALRKIPVKAPHNYFSLTERVDKKNRFYHLFLSQVPQSPSVPSLISIKRKGNCSI